MSQSMVTELALRAAVNSATRDISPASNQPQEIQAAAEKRAEQLSGTLPNISAQSNLQTMAIAAAVKGLELSYSAVKAQLEHLNQKRLAFDKERQAGISTFILPTNKIETKLSTHEHIIKNFMALVGRNDSFESYLGIHTSALTDMKDAEFYSVFPFFRMSEAIEQPLASTRSIDKQRIAISLFLKSALPSAIANIDNDFQNENGFLEFFKSAWKKDDYLNNFRSPRLIMMSLSNLLWNLQHPVDPTTGFPLGTDRAIEMCNEVSQFLNTLLDNNSPYSLHEINSTDVPILSFVRKIENHVKSLRTAYIEEKLNEINVIDINSSALRILRTMLQAIFELIYTRKNPITKKDEPDSTATSALAEKVNSLNQNLINNPDVIQAFIPFIDRASDTPFLNKPPTTIIDLLIIFIHCTGKEKNELLNKLAEDTSDTNTEFVLDLRNFNEQFIAPIKEISKKELSTSIFKKKSREVATLTARRLVPFITMALEDYRIEVDTPDSYRLAKESATSFHRAKDQLKAINTLAMAGDGYYYWALSPFVKLQRNTEAVLDQLPKNHYRFTQITQLLDSISEIVTNYRSFLQLKSFQQFLIKCLAKIKDEFNMLEHHIENVDKCLSKDKTMSRKMKTILGSMTKELGSSLQAFSDATANFEHIITAPEFIDKQKQLLSAKFNAIHEQYQMLFSDDSGLLDISASDCGQAAPVKRKRVRRRVANATSASDEVTNRPSPNVVQPTIELPIETKRVIALRKLVSHCFDALSYQSRYSEKGKLLANLLQLIDAQSGFTQAQFQHTVRELTQITLSYRSTWFFQAAYAETRSAKALVAAIKNPELGALLPLTTMIFGEGVDVSMESDKQIIERLRNLGKSNQWLEEASGLAAVVSL